MSWSTGTSGGRHQQRQALDTSNPEKASDTSATQPDLRGPSKLLDLLASNILANAVLFTGVYLITRIVSPAEFGKYSLLFSIALSLQPLLTLRYEHAIPVARSNRTALFLAIFCAVSILAVSSAGLLLSSTLSYVGYWPLLEDGQFADLVLLLPPACLALAMYSTAQTIALRTQKLRQLAVSRVARALLVVLCQLLLVLTFSDNASSLVIGELVATIIASAIIIRLSIDLFDFRSVSATPPKLLYLNILAALRRFRTFALIGVPHVFSHSAFTALYGILLGVFFGPVALGQYFLMRRMIFGVTALFSTATYQLGVSEASATKGNPDKIEQLFKTALIIIAVPTIPAALLMLAFGEGIFSAVFGNEWAAAGQFAAATFVLIVVEPIASAIAFVPVFLKRQSEAFAWSIGQNLAGIVSLAGIYALEGSAIAAVFGSSLTVSLILVGYMARVFHLCKQSQTGFAEIAR